MRQFWIGPYIAYIVAFGLLPLLLTFYLVGFNPSAVESLFLDFPPGTFQLALYNTLLFASATALISTLLALILAIRVDSLPRRWQIPLSLLILVPYTIPFTASTMVWYTIFDPLYGPAYYLIKLLRLPMLNLTTVPGLSIWAVTIVGIWGSVSFAYLVIMGGLKTVNKELREVAQIDGASMSQYYFGVVLPYVFKVVVTAFLITFILQLGDFDIPFILTQGGPGYSSTTLPLMVYDLLYFMGDLKAGETVAALLAAIATAPALALLYVMRAGGLYVRMPALKIPDKVFNAALWIFFVAILAFLLFPVYWMFLIAFRPDQYDFITPPIIYPTVFTAKYFLDALARSTPYVVTNVVVGAAAAALSVLLAGPAAYLMAKRNRLGPLLLTIYLYALPPTSFIFPVYLFAVWSNLLNTWWILILSTPIFTATLSAWVFFNVFRDLPNEYHEMAEVEGAGSTRILFRIIAPITRSAWFTLFTLSFIVNWHLLFYPIVLTQTPYQFNFPPTGAQTVTIFAIESIMSTSVDWSTLAASALVVALPVLVLSYLILGRMLEGFNIGGLKG